MLSATAAARIDAPADVVYAILRDFRRHHANILPPAFSDFEVLEGGFGAGTVTSFTTTLGGRAIKGRTVVSEPEPRVMVEHVVGRDMVTTFRVVADGLASWVSIHTAWTPVSGLAGLLERAFAPRMLTSVYRQELRLLQGYAPEVVSGRSAGEPTAAPQLAAAHG
jgi:Polyketide cyclase / dehydrase and lipid transport